jgi:hypothetical protein
MPNPFPGMDPYLEAHWSDVHARLVIIVRESGKRVVTNGQWMIVQLGLSFNRRKS